MTKNLVGNKFGRWTVIGVAEKRRNGNSGTRVYWECLCECGNKGIVVTHVLTRGSSKSCGCLRKEGHRILPHGVSERNLLLYTYKRNAEKRNLCFSLTAEQFEELIQKECFYCGEKPKNKLNGKWFNGEYFYNGIDRVNNDIGYTLENSVSCCEACNKAKRVMSEDEFADWIVRVYRHFAAKKKFWSGIYLEFQGDGTAEWWRRELEEQGISK